MMNKYYYMITFLVFFGYRISAQETLLPLQTDPVLREFYNNSNPNSLKNQMAEPMFLPFFDDFNQYSLYPDSKRWLGINVYVNKKYQYFPPDLGVATFDAMDGSGKIHSNAGPYSFPADTLLSQPIRLDSLMDPVLRPVLVSDSIYFSFYYQPQGQGNAPEETDKLTLEFYSPALDQWDEVWSSEGTTLDSLFANAGTYAQQVFIAVNDSARYYHSGFQFRFHNMASLAGNSQPDWQGNCDHWNIDLVWFDYNRTITDSSYRKIAFISEPPSMIKRYESMPYRQYRNDPTNSMKESLDSVYISNLDDEVYTSTYSFKISGQTNQDSIYNGGSADILPFAESGYSRYPGFLNPIIDMFFSIYNETFKTYAITHTVNDIGFTGIGDTVVRIQEFGDYYAYDDGTPEAGYGLSNSSGKAALQFKLNSKDTLSKVQIYFNPTLTSANEQYFYLMVWKNLEPEEVLYKKTLKVAFDAGLYKYITFDLDTSIVLANEFYVGFEQITADNLNIGFDFAHDSHEYLFYNTGSEWNSSLYEGSLMIRPVFGSIGYVGVQESKPDLLKIYPNPLMGDYLYFNWPGKNPDELWLDIYHIGGQQVYSRRAESLVMLESLSNGVYIVKLTDPQTGETVTRKLIKQAR
jgi:hypothetical protein